MADLAFSIRRTSLQCLVFDVTLGKADALVPVIQDPAGNWTAVTKHKGHGATQCCTAPTPIQAIEGAYAKLQRNAQS